MRLRLRRMMTTALSLAAIGLALCLAGASTPEASPAPPAPPAPPTPRPTAEETGPARIWVFLTDKGPIDTQRAIAALESTYSERAIERRRLRRTAPGLFDERDLPVHEGYIEDITATGATIRIRSRWLNAVSVEATAGQIARIASLPFVEKVQPLRPLTGDPDRQHFRGGSDARAMNPLPRRGFYGYSEAQLNQITIIDLHNAGYTAEGIIIGILDTGFKRTHTAYNHPDHPLDVIAEWDFVNDDGETAPEEGDLPDQHEHGTYILGTIAAYWPEVLVGGAFDASFILAKVEDVESEYPAEEDLFVAGLEYIEAQGGDVATSSVVIYDHYTQEELDGLTSVMTIGLNTAAENGLHCCQGAGNSGHDNDPSTSHLLPPADAFQVITVGAVNSGGDIAGFSSDGPTADGRLKPEVLTRGVSTYTTSAYGDESLSAPNGTSLATPLAASAVACLVQARPEWTVNQMRVALFQRGDYYIDHGVPDPLFICGFGIIDAFASSQTAPSPADLDGDCDVDVQDLLCLLAAWGPCEGCPEDLNGDGSANVPDLLELLAAWGPCG